MRAREFILEKPLAPAELRKRNNLQTFINKVINGEEFETVDGYLIKVSKNPNLIKGLQQGLIPSALPTIPKGTVKLSQLKKTKEFGGEDSGKRLQKQTTQVNELDSAIKDQLNGKSYIPLSLGSDKKIVRAAGAIEIGGTPKADVAIIDDQGVQVAWVSLKDGTTPKGFGQWGGLTDSSLIERFPEIKKFVNLILSKFGDKFPAGPTYGMEIRDSLLKAKTTFGKNFGDTTEKGINNVDVILQGTPVLKKDSSGIYQLSAAKIWYNGDVPDGDYDPVLIVRYTSDRGNFGIQGARISSYPRAGRPWKPLDSTTSADLDKEPAIPQPNLNPKTTTTLTGTEFTTPTTKGQFNRNVALEVSKIPMKSK